MKFPNIFQSLRIFVFFMIPEEIRSVKILFGTSEIQNIYSKIGRENILTFWNVI